MELTTKISMRLVSALVNSSVKYYEAEADEYFQHDYIVYADSMNVLNGFKPFKIASRLSVGKMKTPWSGSRVADGMSFETCREAEEYLEEYFRLCNIKYKERRESI